MPVAMVAKLWQVSEPKARRLLRGGRDRSLVLEGIDGGFRLHDLLHDLAQQLLVAPTNGSDENLPGLGLTVAAAHGALLERYRPESGDWADLVDDGYIHGRLTWHMERAGQIRDIHQLIRQGRADGRNAWYEACEGLGQLPIFVEDVARAWRLAEETYGIIPTEPEGWDWQMWCAFVTVSLNSLVGNVPSNLIAALVEKGVWSEARGLAYAMQKRQEDERDKAIAELVPHLSSRELVHEALEVVWNMVAEGDRILKAVVIHRWEFVDDPLDIASEIDEEYWRDQALANFANRLPIERLPEALQIVRDISSPGLQVEALSNLANKLPAELLLEALNIVRHISDDLARAEGLLSLSDPLPELVPEAFQIAVDTSDERSRQGILLKIADKLPRTLFPESLKIVRDLEESSHIRPSRALSYLADDLPEDLLPEALGIARGISDDSFRLEALTALNGRLPQLSSEVLQLVRTINQYRFTIPSINWCKNIAVELFPEVLRVIQDLSYGFSQAEALVFVSKKLPVELLPKALQITHDISINSAREKPLSALAQRLPPELLPEAVKIARGILDNSVRVRALASLSRRSPNLLPEGP